MFLNRRTRKQIVNLQMNNHEFRRGGLIRRLRRFAQISEAGCKSSNHESTRMHTNQTCQLPPIQHSPGGAWTVPAVQIQADFRSGRMTGCSRDMQPAMNCSNTCMSRADEVSLSGCH